MSDRDEDPVVAAPDVDEREQAELRRLEHGSTVDGEVDAGRCVVAVAPPVQAERGAVVSGAMQRGEQLSSKQFKKSETRDKQTPNVTKNQMKHDIVHKQSGTQKPNRTSRARTPTRAPRCATSSAPPCVESRPPRSRSSSSSASGLWPPRVHLAEHPPPSAVLLLHPPRALRCPPRR